MKSWLSLWRLTMTVLYISDRHWWWLMAFTWATVSLAHVREALMKADGPLLKRPSINSTVYTLSHSLTLFNILLFWILSSNSNLCCCVTLWSLVWVAGVWYHLDWSCWQSSYVIYERAYCCHYGEQCVSIVLSRLLFSCAQLRLRRQLELVGWLAWWLFVNAISRDLLRHEFQTLFANSMGSKTWFSVFFHEI